MYSIYWFTTKCLRSMEDVMIAMVALHICVFFLVSGLYRQILMIEHTHTHTHTLIHSICTMSHTLGEVQVLCRGTDLE